MMAFAVNILILFSFLSLGCAQQKNGFSPLTNPNPTTPVEASQTKNVNLGQKVTTATGWEVAHSAGDVIQTKSTSSTWTVEVQYE